MLITMLIDYVVFLLGTRGDGSRAGVVWLSLQQLLKEIYCGGAHRRASAALATFQVSAGGTLCWL